MTQNLNANPEPTPSSSEPNGFKERLVSTLKEWPSVLADFFKSPTESMAKLSHEGPWEVPILYVTATGLASGLLNMIFFGRQMQTHAVQLLIPALLMWFIGLFVGGFVINVILGAVKKQPSLYRTCLFIGILSIVGPISMIVGRIVPTLSWVVSLVPLYMLYFYAQVAAEWSKKQALIMVVILAAIPVLAILGTL